MTETTTRATDPGLAAWLLEKLRNPGTRDDVLYLLRELAADPDAGARLRQVVDAMRRERPRK